MRRNIRNAAPPFDSKDLKELPESGEMDDIVINSTNRSIDYNDDFLIASERKLNDSAY